MKDILFHLASWPSNWNLWTKEVFTVNREQAWLSNLDWGRGGGWLILLLGRRLHRVCAAKIWFSLPPSLSLSLFLSLSLSLSPSLVYLFTDPQKHWRHLTWILIIIHPHCVACFFQSSDVIRDRYPKFEVANFIHKTFVRNDRLWFDDKQNETLL